MSKREFSRGNAWLRIDLHLHTKADSEFKYNGSSYVDDYIEALKSAGIEIAAITNHNKFDMDEFMLLYEKASENGIWLLPGIELEVRDGKRGIHTLIVFDDKEFKKDKNFINNFLIQQLDLQTNQPNKNLEQLLKDLDNSRKNYILILAHVDNEKGFLKELKPANYRDWIVKKYFREKIVALQDIGESSIKIFENELRNKLGNEWQKYRPAYVSFTDAKSIDDITSKNKKTFVNIGDYNFTALKFAFLNHEIRIERKFPRYKYSKIVSIEVKNGNFMKEAKLLFNHSLNNIIGIRGSGKSSIIEILRWVLGKKPLKNSDEIYKENLINYVLGNGGEVILIIETNDGIMYKIKRSYTDSYPIISDENGRILQIKNIKDLFDFVYFGQKDLSEISRNQIHQLKLIDDFINDEIRELETQEKKVKQDIREIVKKLKSIKVESQNIEFINDGINTLKEKIKIFKEKGVDKLLEKQVLIEKEKQKAKFVLEVVEEIENDVKKIEESIFQKFEMILVYNFDWYGITFKEKIKKLRDSLTTGVEDIKNVIKKFFESIEQEIKSAEKREEVIITELSEAKKTIDPNLDANFYINANSKIQQLELKLKKIKQNEEQLKKYKNDLEKELSRLKNIHREIYNKRKEFAEKIKVSIPFLRVKIEFRGNKEEFKNYLGEMLRGTRIRESKIRKLSEKFYDGFSLYKAIENNDSLLFEILGDSDFYKLKEKVDDYLEDFIVYCAPDKVSIEYRVNETDYIPIDRLSIGQRAAAILSLILYNQKMPVIIDQPEDDIDNSTIYEGIIKTILNKKNNNQFIFATHNSNIVVLGDSDNVFVCENKSGELKITRGSIDKKEIQRKVVSIMEGGSEAFNKRKIIYKLWI